MSVAIAIVGGVIAYKNGGNVLAGAAAGVLLAGSVTATASAVADAIANGRAMDVFVYAYKGVHK